MKTLVLSLIFLFFQVSLFSRESRFPFGEAVAIELCYEISRSESGFGSTLYSQALFDEACAVKAMVTAHSNADFDVVGHDYYYLLVKATPNYNFEQAFRDALRAEYQSRSSFIVIAKDILPTGKVAHRVELKLPDVAPYTSVSALEEAVMASMIEKRIKEVADLNNAELWANAAAEIAGLRLLADLLNQIHAGTLNLAGDFNQAGFSAEPINDEGLFVRGIGPAYIGPVGSGSATTVNVHDFVNLEVGIGNDGTLFRDLMGAGFGSSVAAIEELGPLSATLIITDPLSNNAELDLAATAFNNSSEKMVIWFHHTPDTLYTKKLFNFTQDEADIIIGHFYLQRMQLLNPDFGNGTEPPAAAFSGGNAEESKSLPDECALDYEQSCGLSWTIGKDCVLHEINDAFDDDPSTSSLLQITDGMNRLKLGIVVGIFDGLLGTIQYIYDATTSVVEWVIASVQYVQALWDIYLAEGWYATKAKVIQDLNGYIDKVVNAYNEIKVILQQLDWNKISALFKEMLVTIETWFGGLANGCTMQGYDIGVLMFEVILGFFSGGTSVAGKLAAKYTGKAMVKIMQFLDEIHIPGSKRFDDLFYDSIYKVENSIGNIGEKLKLAKCKILGKGCFVKDTPVWMAGSTNGYAFGSKAKALALAAALPVLPMPIQEVPLLGYALAHETVNAGPKQLASAEDALYLDLSVQDPYTSDQQRDRDKYEVNDTDWNEVVFEEITGSSTARLALHNDWITQKGYETGAVVQMHLPEQGITGPFRITSIKHLLPQKKPMDEDPTDEYGYRPVTAIFTHVSDQVFRLTFEDGETLGVTARHPIYSTTAGTWRLAGDLREGERVLIKAGVARVVKSERQTGAQTVYNLEVQQAHNFLAGQSGVLVHNSGLCSFLKSFFNQYANWRKAEPDWGLDDDKVNNLMDALKRNSLDVYSTPIYTTTYNGKTYLINGHHRLKAAKRLKEEQGINVELQHYDINPENISEVEGGRFRTIQDLVNQSFGPDE